jgi:hypothetical protein
MATKAVAKKQSGALQTEARPDWMSQTSHRGAENVGTEDLSIPRIDVIQALSPQRKKSDPAYIEGAEEGMLYNSITGELYGPSINFIPVFFRKEYIVWKDRDSGGGFCGAFVDRQEAVDRAAELGADLHDVNDTAQHFVLVVKGDGSLEEAVLSMAKSKLKCSRQLNTLCRMAGGDTFGSVYALTTQEAQSDKGDYWSYGVKRVGWVEEDQYKAGESLYESIAGGKRDVNRGSNESEDSAGADDY